MSTPRVRELGGYDVLGGGWLRVDRATATLPQTASVGLFTITGGQVEIGGIIGEVTTVVETQANATKLKLNPDATGVDQDLCATLDITADPVGEIYTIDGVVGNALRSDLLIGQSMTNALILSEGSIELDCAASNTGNVKWSVLWRPLDNAGNIVAA